MQKTYIFTHGNLEVIFVGQSSETGCWIILKRMYPNWPQADVKVQIISEPCVFEREVE